MVLVLAACVLSPVSWTESQRQAIALESESELEASGDHQPIADRLPVLIVNEFRESSPIIPETLSRTGSDAYPSITLHGPPVPKYPV